MISTNRLPQPEADDNRPGRLVPPKTRNNVRDKTKTQAKTFFFFFPEVLTFQVLGAQRQGPWLEQGGYILMEPPWARMAQVAREEKSETTGTTRWS